MQALHETESRLSARFETTSTVMEGPASTSRSLQIIPPQVNFRDVGPKMPFKTVVTARNMGSVSHRVRFLPPKGKGFSMVYKPSNSPIAPGMSVSIEVLFKWKDEELREDQISEVYVITDKERLTIPLIAHVPAPDLQSPEAVNLGDVITQNSVYKVIDILNNGSLPGKFRVEYDQKLPLSITPQVGQVDAHGKAPLKFELRGREPGIFSTSVQLHVGAGVVTMINVTAKVLEQRIALVMLPEIRAKLPKGVRLSTVSRKDEDDESDSEDDYSERRSSTTSSKRKPSKVEIELERIDFGTVYFGQGRTVTAVLVNTGPQPSSFVAYNPADAAMTSRSMLPGARESLPTLTEAMSMAEDEQESVNSSIMTAYPYEGRLGPFESKKISFKFNPKQEEKRSGFVSRLSMDEEESHTFTVPLVIDIVETQQRLKVHLSGKAVKPIFEVSQTVFYFGDCKTNDHIDIQFIIKNGCEELPVPFKFTRAAHFHTIPETGSLKPGEEREVVMSFMPRQMGRFSASISVAFGHPPILRVPISMTGSSLRHGSNMKLIGGIDKLPEDFQRKINPVTEGNEDFLHSITPRAHVRQNQVQKIKHDLLDPMPHVDRVFAMKPEEAAWKLSQKSHYEGFVKKSHEQRMERERAKHRRAQADFENEIDIGIIPGSGLDEPELEVPNQVDPLWLERDPDAPPPTSVRPGSAQKMNRTGARRPRQRRNIDPTHLIKKKFKLQPSTPAEARECATALTPSQLVSVSSGTKSLDFGEVCVFSEHVRSFTFVNDLKQHCLVAIYHDSPELERTSPLSQVVPPGGIAGFDVVFSSPVVQNFLSQMTYTINGHHTYKLNVGAQVIPTVLELSTSLLQFAFLDDDLEFKCAETVQISNPGAYPADFRWEVPPSSPFSLDLVEGTVLPGKSINCRVEYVAGKKHRDEETLLLIVHGGLEVPLKCICDMPEVRCQFTEKMTEFGILPVGLSKELSVTLKNPSNADAVFAWDESHDVGLKKISMLPARGRVPASGHVQICVSLCPEKSGSFSGSASFLIRGGKPIRFTLRAEAAIPQVRLVPEALDFDQVFVGVQEERKMVLQNEGSIPAQITVDFSAAKLLEEPKTEEGAAIVPSSEFVIEKAVGTGPPRTPGEGPGIVPLVPVGFTGDDGDAQEDEEEAKPCAWALTVEPGQNLEFNVVFKPTVVAKHSFQLPVRVTGAVEEDAQTPVIKAESMRAPLLVSERVVDFGTRVVMRGPGGSHRGHYSSLILANNCDEKLTWKLDLSKNREEAIANAFKYEPATGSLAPGQRATVRVAFAPTTEGTFHTSVPLLYNGNFYRSLEVKGVCTHPRIVFDRHTVVLPTVPLGFAASGMFTVINQGYDSLELKYRVPVEASGIPLSVNFPEGNQLGFNRQRVPCLVTFKSRRPTSFTARLEFYDSDGNDYSIRISGMTDNSVLSLYPFLKLRTDAYEVQAKPGKLATVVEKDIIRKRKEIGVMTRADEGKENFFRSIRGEDKDDYKMRRKASAMTLTTIADSARSGSVMGEGSAMPQQQHLPDVFELAVLPEDGAVVALLAGQGHQTADTFAERDSQAVLAYLNAAVLKAPIENIVQSFTGSSGKLLIEVLETLSGRMNISKVISRPGDSRDQRALGALKQAADCLDFLRQHGALLGPIKPEYLLKYDDFKRIARIRQQEAEITGQSETSMVEGDKIGGHGSTRKRIEKLFPQLSRESWLMTIIQAIRVFSLNKINSKTLKHTPGSQSGFARSDDRKFDSMLYSVPECLLLKWLQFHYHKIYNEKTRRISSFTSDLRDSVVLYATVKSHITLNKGIRASKDTEIILNGSGAGGKLTREELLSNAELLMKSLQELGIEYRLRPSDIVEANSIVMLMFTLHLFNTLPQFVPRTVVSFPAKLQQQIIRKIELDNPSNRAIVYAGQIVGSNEFYFVRSTDDSASNIQGNTSSEIRKVDVIVEAKSSAVVEIGYSCRFIRPATGLVLLLPHKRSGALPAERLVFELKVALPLSMTSQVQAEAEEEEKEETDQKKVEDGAKSDSGGGNGIDLDTVWSRDVLTIAEIDSVLYEPEKFDVEIDSPFDNDGEFAVYVVQEKIIEAPKKQTRTRGRNIPARRGKQPAEDMKPITEPCEVFLCHQHKVSLSPRKSASITVTFLPTIPGRYRCRAVLMDENTGECAVEVQAICRLPQVAPEILRFNCELGKPIIKDVVVPAKNGALERARQLYGERSGGRGKERSGAEHILQLAIRNGAVKEKARDVDKIVKMWIGRQLSLANQQLEAQGILKYRLELSSKFFSAPNEIQLSLNEKDAPKGEARRKDGLYLAPQGPAGSAGLGDIENAFPLTLTAKAAGIYPCRMILRSAIDVRVFESEVRAVAPGARATLDFQSCARQPISQEIPFDNPTDQPWSLKATVTGKFFSGPRDLHVGAHGTANYPLVYRPLVTGSTTGELFVLNDKTGEKITFTLRGIAEDALAEDHVVIRCPVRQKKIQKFVIPAVASEYNVVSDLPFVSGPAKLSLPGAMGGEYALEVAPLRAGVYSGALSFNSTDGQTVWYTVEVVAEQPKPEKEINVATVSRVPVAVSFNITNPVSEPIEFTVEVEGDDEESKEIVAPPTLSLGPNETKEYELFYLAVLPDKHDVVVRFSSPRAGEFWYLLHLQAERSPSITLRHMSCEVGSKTSQTITVENPLDLDITLQSNCTNSRNFKLIPADLPVPALDTATAVLEYAPSSIGNKETSTVLLYHPKAGEFAYTVSGAGKQPTRMPPREILCVLGTVVTGTISFRNPFPESLHCSTDVESYPVHEPSRTGEGVALLENFEKVFDLAPFGEIEIPYSFTPLILSEYSAEVLVKENGEKQRNLLWRFPLSGVVEVPPAPTDTSALMSCPARTAQDQEIVIELYDSLPVPDNATSAQLTQKEARHYRYELECEPSLEKFVRGSCTVELARVEAHPESRLPCVVFKFGFAPLRPAAGSCELVIRRPGVGLWRKSINLRASEPEIDDVITIETVLNKTGSVSFKLSNAFEVEAPFHAFFTSSSPAEFTVVPSEGTLPHRDSEGATFVVSYTPSQYGKALSGIVVIQTDEVQWTYEVHGRHPEYRSPKKVLRHAIDSRLSKEVENKLSIHKDVKQKKSFMRNNINKFRPAAVAKLSSPVSRSRMMEMAAKNDARRDSFSDRTVRKGSMSSSTILRK